MRILPGPVVFLGCLLAACSNSSPTTSQPPTVVGYNVVMTIPVDTLAQTGADIPVLFTVRARESDGSSQPASGQAIAVSVTAGGGTLTPGGGGVTGAVNARLTTTADGTASVTWTLGSAAGTQTLHGSLSSVENVDLNVTATTP
jgi:hypothetical protein